jgi:phospholipase/lecithinase/hemolysin
VSVAGNSGTQRPETFAAECGARADEYFWLNSLHPTTPVHDALASEVAKVLKLSAVVSNAFKNALGMRERSVKGEERV